MADESDRFALRVDDALGRGDVVFERKRRILDDAHVVAVLLQAAVDTVPAGAVHEAAVDEDNILGWAISHEKSPCRGRVFPTLRLPSTARKAVWPPARGPFESSMPIAIGRRSWASTPTAPPRSAGRRGSAPSPPGPRRRR